MNGTCNRTWNISDLARATGLKRYVIATLLKTHEIPCVERSNYTQVGEWGLRKLDPILRRYPGVDPSFADKL
jgi:hypothetical protein